VNAITSFCCTKLKFNIVC